MKTKRKIAGLIVLMFVLGVVWADAAFAFKNEPTGFRGSKWGTEVGDLTFKVTKVKSLEEIKVDFYTINQLDNSFESLMITLDGRLAMVVTKLKDMSKAEVFAKIMVELYGPPQDVTEEAALWTGETSSIEFSPNEGVIIIGSTTGMQSVSALLEWYSANIKKRAI